VRVEAGATQPEAKYETPDTVTPDATTPLMNSRRDHVEGVAIGGASERRPGWERVIAEAACVGASPATAGAPAPLRLGREESVSLTVLLLM
jgi:hypothetical protein